VDVKQHFNLQCSKGRYENSLIRDRYECKERTKNYTKNPSDETILNLGPPCVYTHAQRSPTHVKDPVAHDRVRWLWKHQNNPACTKSVRAFIMLKLDTELTEEDEEEGGEISK